MDALGCEAECESVTPFDGNEGPIQSVLTDRQRTALLTAFEMGYYDIPRCATAEDIADEFYNSSDGMPSITDNTSRFTVKFHVVAETRRILSRREFGTEVGRYQYGHC
ncbi:helix-turn-helix domain-containing protein [Halococcus hamelinensis]|nr:helix-turn-helix domain-containing protein [Halococcus hamelinensis]